MKIKDFKEIIGCLTIIMMVYGFNLLACFIAGVNELFLKALYGTILMFSIISGLRIGYLILKWAFANDSPPKKNKKQKKEQLRELKNK